MSAPKPLGYLHRTASPPIFITITPHAEAMAEWMPVFERPVSVSREDVTDAIFAAVRGDTAAIHIVPIVSALTVSALAALGIEVTP